MNVIIILNNNNNKVNFTEIKKQSKQQQPVKVSVLKQTKKEAQLSIM